MRRSDGEEVDGRHVAEEAARPQLAHRVAGNEAAWFVWNGEDAWLTVEGVPRAEVQGYRACVSRFDTALLQCGCRLYGGLAGMQGPK